MNPILKRIKEHVEKRYNAVFFFLLHDFRSVTNLALWDPGWSLTLSSDGAQKTPPHWFPSCHDTVAQQVAQQVAQRAAMTVTYSRRVADAGLGTFFHLLLRWKGSIYKLLYRELIIFTLLYYFFSIVYRYSHSRTAIFLYLFLYLNILVTAHLDLIEELWPRFKVETCQPSLEDKLRNRDIISYSYRTCTDSKYMFVSVGVMCFLISKTKVMCDQKVPPGSPPCV